ncbi:MBL fold metallo-hydrolase [Arthrobacter sp. GCM10027362]|uniref:MBL fold metallo-hydrolase n=1 Tax=Arthrobacter sp. GCM10027362 TaxID=3273379 RepID=UPI003638A80E
MNESSARAVTRRALLGAGAATAALATTAAAPAAASGHRTPRSNTHVVLLGTAGGPSLLQGSDRHGISSAVVVGDRYYLVDAGHGIYHQLLKARLGNWNKLPAEPLDGLRAVFLTHLHSDHVSDLATLFTSGLFAGLDRADPPVQLIGPGDRGVLPPVFGGVPEPAIVAPEEPTPGTTAMWHHLIRAFATDYNDRSRDNGKPSPHNLVEAHDIVLPSELAADPNGTPHPAMNPIDVYEDDRVKVTGILVQHAPIFPAFAFRFDTEDGSVVFSGDTSPSDNLIRLADGADVLLHEVMSVAAVEEGFPKPRTPQQEGLVQHLLSAHTSIEDVGPVAERAGAKKLVLHHFVPPHRPEREWRNAQKGFSGRLIVGQDLDVINVGTGRSRGQR